MISILRNIHLLNGLSTADLEVIADICSEKTAEPGEIVIEEGTPGNEIYIIADGHIEVFVSSGSEERVLVHLMAGQLFGEMSLINQGPRSASGRAGKDGCRMLMFDATTFTELCENRPRIGYRVMRNLAHDLSFKIRHQNMAKL